MIPPRYDEIYFEFMRALEEEEVELKRYRGEEGGWYRAIEVDSLLAEKDAQIEQLQIRIEQLESAARDYIAECERFHKPA
jgi:hypothetical protein